MIRIFRVHAPQNKLPAFWVSDSLSLWKGRMVSNFQWGLGNSIFRCAAQDVCAYFHQTLSWLFLHVTLLESEKDNLGGSGFPSF